MKRRTNIWLDKIQIEKLKKNFEKTGIRPSEAIRRAIDSYFEKQERGENDRSKPDKDWGT